MRRLVKPASGVSVSLSQGLGFEDCDKSRRAPLDVKEHFLKRACLNQNLLVIRRNVFEFHPPPFHENKTALHRLTRKRFLHQPHVLSQLLPILG